jgi:hypothetical protein
MFKNILFVIVIICTVAFAADFVKEGPVSPDYYVYGPNYYNYVLWSDRYVSSNGDYIEVVQAYHDAHSTVEFWFNRYLDSEEYIGTYTEGDSEFSSKFTVETYYDDGYDVAQTIVGFTPSGSSTSSDSNDSSDSETTQFPPVTLKWELESEVPDRLKSNLLKLQNQISDVTVSEQLTEIDTSIASVTEQAALWVTLKKTMTLQTPPDFEWTNQQKMH